MIEETKQEVINELSRLYVLQNEGINVTSLIIQYEELLQQLTDEEIDKKKRKR